MIKFKNRSIDRKQKVRVHRNLNKGKKTGEVWYSVLQKVIGRWLVMGYMKTVTLKQVVPRISKAGQRRVIKTGHKNVHAYLEGFICEYEIVMGDKFEKVRYNPYTTVGFIRESGNPFLWGDVVFLNKEGILSKVY